jgi:hypothetical protein
MDNSNDDDSDNDDNDDDNDWNVKTNFLPIISGSI